MKGANGRADKVNIYIEKDEVIYEFANLKLVARDGSIYISLKRAGQSSNYFSWDYPTSPRSKKINRNFGTRQKLKKISYHSSGMIIFNELSGGPIFCEPVACVTRFFSLLRICIPETNRLDLCASAPKDDDFTIPLSSFWDGRWDLEISISPWDMEIPISGVTYSFRFEGLLSINFTLSDHVWIPEKGFQNYFIYYTPSVGIFDKKKLEEDAALILFHQKQQNKKGILIYPPNNTGITMVVFSVPMRIPPKVHIEYREVGFKIEEISKTTAMLKFKLKNRHGHYVKEQKVMKLIELDSEL